MQITTETSEAKKTNGHAAKAPAQHKTIYIPIGDAKPGKNYRKRFDDNRIDDLAKSLKEHGQIEPACVRPVGDGFEIVFGECRWRALKKAGLPALWAYVREDLDDATVLELQMTENGERDDVHELDEAEGFETLMKKHGRTAEQIAERLKMSKAHVYQRLKLLALSPASRKAFLDGKLTSSTAYYVARIPDAKLQAEAIEAIGPQKSRFEDESREEPMGARDAARVIRDRFMLRLVDAPFDRADAALVAKAGACTACPKRTGNQPELFDDVKSVDVCTDPACFAEKRVAHGAKKLEEARKAGRTVIEGKPAAKLFQKRGYGDDARPAVDLAYDAKYVELEKEHWTGSKHVKVSTLVKKAGAAAPGIVVAVDGAGQARELVAKADLPKLLKAAGIKEPSYRDGGSSLSAGEKARRAKAAAAQKRAKATQRATIGALVDAAEKKAPTLEQWRCLAHAAITMAWFDDQNDALYRRTAGLAKRQQNADRELVKLTAGMSEGELRGVVVEMISKSSTMAGLAKAFGVTPAVVKKRAAADEKAFEAAKKSAKQKKGAATKS